jgi:hypothetical protein
MDALIDMRKYMNRYRLESFRAPWHDYSDAGHYFVTIVTKNRRPYNLASIMRGFKSAVMIQAKKRGVMDFGWQPLYYDRILRDQKQDWAVDRYIGNNPKNWKYLIC